MNLHTNDRTAPGLNGGAPHGAVIDAPEYPREWRYDESGAPRCAAFVPSGEAVPQPRCPHTMELPL